MCNKKQYLWAYELSAKYTIFAVVFAIWRWLPVVVFLLLCSYIWFVYVIVLCFRAVQHDLQCIIYMVIFHINLILLLWSYAKVTTKPVAKVPKRFRVPEITAQELESLNIKSVRQIKFKRRLLNALVEEKDLDIKMCDKDSTIEYCYRCRNIKPDRTHHCTRCGTCVIKFDHHCPWINSCIHFGNYKYFMLMLFYVTIYCLFIIATTFQFFIQFFLDKQYKNPDLRSRYNLIVMIVMALLFLVYPVVPLFQYHIRLLRLNETTCEQQKSIKFPGAQRGDKVDFSLGCMNNFKTVFGHDIILWFVPVWTTPGDGCSYKAMKGDTSWNLKASTFIQEKIEEE